MSVTKSAIQKLDAANADIIELGVPYSVSKITNTQQCCTKKLWASILCEEWDLSVNFPGSTATRLSVAEFFL